MEDKEIINEIKQDFKTHEEKYKQIKDIAKVLDECCNVYDADGRHVRNMCNSCDCEYWCDTNNLCCSYNKKEATAIYNAGYQKIDEDHVVLTKKEHNQLLATIHKLKQYDEQRDIALHQRLSNEAGKEKALEIYLWFKNIFMNNETFGRGVFGWTTDDLMVVLEVFTKQFNIEV